MISWSSFSPAYDHPGVSTPPGACLSLRPPFDPAQKPVAGGSSTLASDTGALPVLPGTERRFLSVLCSRVILAHLWFVALCLAVAVLVGGEVVYVIGRISGPRIFQSGRGHLLGSEAVERTNAFFGRWGVVAVVIARFVPVARTVVPLA